VTAPCAGSAPFGAVFVAPSSPSALAAADGPAVTPGPTAAASAARSTTSSPLPVVQAFQSPSLGRSYSLSSWVRFGRRACCSVSTTSARCSASGRMRGKKTSPARCLGEARSQRRASRRERRAHLGCEGSRWRSHRLRPHALCPSTTSSAPCPPRRGLPSGPASTPPPARHRRWAILPVCDPRTSRPPTRSAWGRTRARGQGWRSGPSKAARRSGTP